MLKINPQFQAVLKTNGIRRYQVVALVIISLLGASTIWAQNSYYIDSQNGDNSNSGLTESAPWQSHTKVETADLQPGDIVYFARGSAWTGGIQIDSSGSEGQPIILTNYGTGELPRFSNPNWSDNTGNAIRFNGDYLIAEGLYFHNVPPPPSGGFTTVWKAGALRLLLGADHCIIRNCYFDTVPKAIQSHGEHTLITHNTMIGEQVLLGSQYWGPIGIQIGIGNQEISYNTISEFWVTEGHAWGQDGGAIEMDDGRNHKDNVYIHHNRTINNCGFLEVSYNYDIEQREVWNLRVAFNLSADYQSIGFLEAPLHDSHIDNNTFDRSRQLNFNSSMEVQLGTPVVRNNLIILDGPSPYRADDGQHHVDQQNNWYYQLNNSDQVYFPETAAGNGDPGLLNFVAGGDSDYHLRINSELRGSGINLNEYYSSDYDSVALPATGSWDVGALQFSGFGITTPEDGDVYNTSEDIVINAEMVNSTLDIANVEFYVGTEMVGEDNTNPYSYIWNTDAVGNYLLTATAIGADDEVMNSIPVWVLVTDASIDGNSVWHSYDVVTSEDFHPATVFDEEGTTPTVVNFYMSSNSSGVERGNPLRIFHSESHIDTFNHVEKFWSLYADNGGYPYAGKSSVDRGSDTGESEMPDPLGVRDLQLHPPSGRELVVAAFAVPVNGFYTVSNLAARRVDSGGETAILFLFDSERIVRKALVASNDRSWAQDESDYTLGELEQGDQIYFCVGRGDRYYVNDATEIAWSVTYSDTLIVSTGPTPQGVLPIDFRFSQNYPNPFNPTTTISYSLPEQSTVNLVVFDIRGQEVTTLLTSEKPPGNYEVQWNGMDQSGNHMSTGVYFCRLDAGSFSNTIKMVYLK